MQLPTDSGSSARTSILILLLGALALGACTDHTPVAPDLADSAPSSTADPALVGPTPTRIGIPFIYWSGFEPPTYSPGLLQGQDGWITVIGGAEASTIARRSPRWGRQSLHLDGRHALPVPGTAFRGIINARDLFYDTRAAGTPVIFIGATVRLDGPRTTRGCSEPRSISANLVAIGSDLAGRRQGIAWAMLDSGGEFCGSAPQGGPVGHVPIDLGRFYRLDMRLDFEQRTVEYFLNGRSVATAAFRDPGAVSGVLVAVRLDLSGSNDPSFDPGLYRAYFDHVSVLAWPASLYPLAELAPAAEPEA